jgi:hypothetical protein
MLQKPGQVGILWFRTSSKVIIPIEDAAEFCD